MTPHARCRASFGGEVAAPDDPGYEAARRVWNGNVDRRPALVARCRGVADVQAALAYARESGLAAVGAGRRPQRAGLRHQRRRPRPRPVADEGHPGRPGRPHRPGRGRGAVARARPGDPGVRPGHDRRHGVEHRHRRAHARRRARLADGQARPHRRQPALRRRRDRRRRLPHRRRRRASPTCSGRCGAAAATSASSPPSSTGCTRSTEVLGGLVAHPLRAAGDVLRFYRELLRRRCPTRRRPTAGSSPTPRRAIPIVALLLGYNGPIEEGERVLRPAREFGQPLADLVGPMPYAARQTHARRAERHPRPPPLLALGVHRAARRRPLRRHGRGGGGVLVTAERAAVLLPARRRHPRAGRRHRLRRPPPAVGLRRHRLLGRRRRVRPAHLLDQVGLGPLRTPPEGRRLHQPPQRWTTRRRRSGPPTARTTSGFGSSRASTTRRTCSGSTRTSSRADRPGGRPAPRLADSPDG